MGKTSDSKSARTILSGVKPTGRPHLGNYFGAMRQFVELQNGSNPDVEVGTSYFMIADYHALNFVQNAEEMRRLSLGVALDFLAIGLNPERSVIFKQSEVPEHTELAWIFDSITTIPYLKRAHAYKDATAKGGEEDVSAGTFTYPMLMAADILLYDTDLVPVGQDQKQHIEYARDTAEKFNRIFGASNSLTAGNIFKLPDEYILKDVEIVPGTDGRKMSKSYGNTISLFAEESEIEEKVMGIVTDSEGERPENVYKIHRLVRDEAELQKIYEENRGKYKMIKEILIDDLKNFIRPLREKRGEISRDLSFVERVLKKGSEKARAAAGLKMGLVRSVIGGR
jgi:tryptophanyl-tRNA synthetase